MVGWTPVDLRPGRAPACGYSEPSQIPLHNLVVSEPNVGKSEISLRSYGDGEARECLRMVAWVMCGWRVGLGAWRTSSRRLHDLYVMEDSGPAEHLPEDCMGYV